MGSPCSCVQKHIDAKHEGDQQYRQLATVACSLSDEVGNAPKYEFGCSFLGFSFLCFLARFRRSRRFWSMLLQMCLQLLRQACHSFWLAFHGEAGI